MAYTDWAERISAYIDNELLSADRGLVESHLAGCPECAKAVEGLRRLSGLVRALPRVAAPAGLLESVRAAVAPPPRGRLIGFIARNRAWVSSAAALVATMLIVYGFYSPSRNRFPEIPAVPTTKVSSGEPAEETASYSTALDRDKAVAMGEQPDLSAKKPAEPATAPKGGVAVNPPAPPQPEKPAQEEADDAARRKSQQDGAGLATTAPPADGVPPPAAPGAATPQPDPVKDREKAAKALAQDLLSSGKAVTMTCADARDAERKVTRLLRDLRVTYNVQGNHTTRVVAEIPADRAEEVLLALEMLEPRRFTWRVPVSAHSDEAKKDFAGEGRGEAEGLAAGKVRAPMESEEAGRTVDRRGYLADDLLARADEKQEAWKEKAAEEREQKRYDSSALTLVISLEALPAADPAAGEGK